MNYIDKTKLPYPYCPGCTHSVILDAVEKALEKIETDPKRTVLVSDIGCVGIADKYFSTHTFHGLHGRSFTYACGIKMARPDLNVFVIVGDGGCGIGGHHLINAARRNVGITVICFNNFNFGMTGGEHSVTTPLEGKTHTTPKGSIEQPFDLCSLVKAAGGSFVARKTAFEKDLVDIIARAMTHDGFSFVDVWELCSAYYSSMNTFKKADLEKYMNDRGLATGIISEELRPEYSRQLNEMMGEKKSVATKGIRPKFKAQFSGGSYNIILAGSAGMKVVSAAAGFARAGLMSGLWASEKDDYPVTVQTGHSISQIKLSKERVHHPGAERLDAVIVISEEGLKKVKVVMGKLTKEDIVVAAKGLPKFETHAEVHEIDLNAAGLTKSNRIVAAIACLLSLRKILDMKAYLAALEAIPNEKIREGCLRAFDVGLSS